MDHLPTESENVKTCNFPIMDCHNPQRIAPIPRTNHQPACYEHSKVSGFLQWKLSGQSLDIRVQYDLVSYTLWYKNVYIHRENVPCYMGKPTNHPFSMAFSSVTRPGNLWNSQELSHHSVTLLRNTSAVAATPAATKLAYAGGLGLEVLGESSEQNNIRTFYVGRFIGVWMGNSSINGGFSFATCDCD